MKNTKIVCTLGPASESRATIEAMVNAGMNVARLNFSHGTYENHHALMANVRAVSKALGVPIAIMQDLQGPKIRVGELAAPVAVKAGQAVVIGKDFAMDFDLSSSVKKGDRILIEDGILELRVEKVAGRSIACRVQNDGVVRSHKGVNIPDSSITFPTITAKDLRDLKFGLENDVDFVAVSFVRSAADIRNVRKLIARHSPKGSEVPLVIAKIEKPEAVAQFDEILAETDGIMVGRGDLGVEVAASAVPIIQKDIVAACIAAGKPVIVATQMLDSMIHNPRPTRAEVSDIVNAVIDGTDATMLSGESAFGSYPLECVAEMADCIAAAEGSRYVRYGELAGAAIATSAAKVTVSAAAVTSFEAATQMSKLRANVPTLAYASSPKLLRQLSLVWGVQPVAVKAFKGEAALRAAAFKVARSMKLAKRESDVSVTSF
jgi:pyruvate kinase